MKGRKHRETGGVNEAARDLETKPEARTNASKIDAAAQERKRGGRAKHVGQVSGDMAKFNAGRKPRKNGGRTGSDSNPFTSARHGTPPKGHSVENV